MICNIGAPDPVLERTRLLRLPKSGTSVETMVNTKASMHSWIKVSGVVPPVDWDLLYTHAGWEGGAERGPAGGQQLLSTLPDAPIHAHMHNTHYFLHLAPQARPHTYACTCVTPCTAGLGYISCVPITASTKIIGVLTIGFLKGADEADAQTYVGGFQLLPMLHHVSCLLPSLPSLCFLRCTTH